MVHCCNGLIIGKRDDPALGTYLEIAQDLTRENKIIQNTGLCTTGRGGGSRRDTDRLRLSELLTVTQNKSGPEPIVLDDFKSTHSQPLLG